LKAADLDENPQHESLTGAATKGETDKSSRTVFLANVSVEAIKSKPARKTLLKHLASFLSELPSDGVSHKLESLRFRSTAFVSGVGPKRAAYAKKELMEETTHSTNAYVVYTTAIAAKRSVAKLNGTVVLGRHLRADLVAKPSVIDHRRCVFVGNLGFVDEEVVEAENEKGEKELKKKGKLPADTEEGLWRTFNKAGKVESVRVVRDRTTRVGKGIAFVQFHDENGVEAALLYNDKRFPPLLPRKLRVTRAHRVKENRAPGGLQSARSQVSGRDHVKDIGRGRGSSSKDMRRISSEKSSKFVFEGHRATKPAPSTSRGAMKKGSQSGKPTTRSSRRGAAFKVAGGKRNSKKQTG
jgi:nucleolar protein 12